MQRPRHMRVCLLAVTDNAASLASGQHATLPAKPLSHTTPHHTTPHHTHARTRPPPPDASYARRPGSTTECVQETRNVACRVVNMPCIKALCTHRRPAGLANVSLIRLNDVGANLTHALDRNETLSPQQLASTLACIAPHVVVTGLVSAVQMQLAEAWAVHSGVHVLGYDDGFALWTADSW